MARFDEYELWMAKIGTWGQRAYFYNEEYCPENLDAFTPEELLKVLHSIDVKAANEGNRAASRYVQSEKGREVFDRSYAEGLRHMEMARSAGTEIAGVELADKPLIKKHDPSE